MCCTKGKRPDRDEQSIKKRTMPVMYEAFPLKSGMGDVGTTGGWSSLHTGTQQKASGSEPDSDPVGSGIIFRIRIRIRISDPERIRN